MRAWKLDYFDGFEPEIVTDDFSRNLEILPDPPGNLPIDLTHFFDRDFWR